MHRRGLNGGDFAALAVAMGGLLASGDLGARALADPVPIDVALAARGYCCRKCVCLAACTLDAAGAGIAWPVVSPQNERVDAILALIIWLFGSSV